MKTNHFELHHPAPFGPSNPVRQSTLPAHSGPPEPVPTSIYRLAGLWEGFLFREKRWATYERYGRALSRFLEAFPGRKDINSFVRPEIISWVQARLAEGASVATVRTELAAIRSFFQFSVDMGQAMHNPARGVKVQLQSSLIDSATGATITKNPRPS